jgi:preprotein translocase subunit SecA
MNKQRKVIYEQRKKVLRGESLWQDIEEMVEEVTENLLFEFIDEKKHFDEWNLKGLDDAILKQFNLKLNITSSPGASSVDSFREMINTKVLELLRNKEQNFGKELMDYLLKVIMLQAIDSHWKEHLLSMDHLKEGIGLRGYGQKDPVREYQREGYEMFMEMISQMKMDTLGKLCLVQVQREEEVEEIRHKQKQDYVLSRGEDVPDTKTVKREGQKVGRNDPCPCGSGKKYKKCCGA